MAAKVKTPDLQAASLTNFSGGPNFRDSPSELAQNEVYDSYNITYDERGGASSRLGYVKRNATALGGTGDKVINDYYAHLLGKWVTQVGASLYVGDAASAVHTFTTDDCVTYTETDNYVVVGHPADGIFYSSDGSSFVKITAANAPTAPLCVCSWQARLWVGLADGSVHWSNIGDILTWDVNDFNEIWTIDQQPIVALHVGSGQDIQGRPGLLAFKQDSVYRINDAATGAYTVIDSQNGCGGPKAVVGVGARVCWIGKQGVFWWAENLAEPTNASDKLRPLWQSQQLSVVHQSGWCAGRKRNRALFSCSTAGSSVNDLSLELHPDEGWLAPRSDAVSCYATSTGTDEVVSGGSPSTDGQVYELESGGTDDGTAIDWYLQTRWEIPNGGFQAQLWQVRLQGRGSGTMTVRVDYESAGGSSFPFDFSSSSAYYYDNSVYYDSGATYAEVVLQGTEPIYGLGTCRQFSLRLSGSSSATADGHQMFPTAPSPIVGEFGLFAVEYLFAPIGLS